MNHQIQFIHKNQRKKRSQQNADSSERRPLHMEQTPTAVRRQRAGVWFVKLQALLRHGLCDAINVNRMTRFSLLCGLWHMDGKDTILVLCRAFAFIDVVDVERTAHAALAALAADVVAFLILLVFRLLILRGNRQIVIVVRKGDVFLLEARQLSREVVAVLVVFDINLEFRSTLSTSMRRMLG